MSVTVADTTQTGRAVAAPSELELSPNAPRSLDPEAVVFPRDGKPLDQRPVGLRKQRAAARYRDDGK